DANTNLTGYSHGFSFGSAPDGSTFGRYVISAGEEQFPLQITATGGQPNSGPKIGPIVINEIHYHPDTGDEQVIELKNVSTNSVQLYDAAYPTNTWKLSGVGFSFPGGIVLGPDEKSLVVAIDPAAFRSK